MTQLREFIANLTEVTDSEDDDVVMILRAGMLYKSRQFGRSDTTPLGMLEWRTINVVPPGYLAADGGAITSATPELRQLYIDAGSPYGQDSNGNPLTPNLMTDGGRFVRAHDPASGRAFGESQQDQIRAHAHNYSGRFGNTTRGSGQIADVSHNSTGTYQTSTVGGEETRPKNISMLPIIKAAYL